MCESSWSNEVALTNSPQSECPQLRISDDGAQGSISKMLMFLTQHWITEVSVKLLRAGRQMQSSSSSFIASFTLTPPSLRYQEWSSTEGEPWDWRGLSATAVYLWLAANLEVKTKGILALLSFLFFQCYSNWEPPSSTSCTPINQASNKHIFRLHYAPGTMQTWGQGDGQDTLPDTKELTSLFRTEGKNIK